MMLMEKLNQNLGKLISIKSDNHFTIRSVVCLMKFKFIYAIFNYYKHSRLNIVLDKIL